MEANTKTEDVEYGSIARFEGEPEKQSFWKITDHGELAERSRDHSVHVTDEVFNSASHLMAAMMSVLGSVILITRAAAQGSPWKIVSFTIYGASLIFLFSASTAHHSITSTKRVMAILRMVDYLAIYPLIAGSFTPMCLVFYHNSTIGWSFFGVVWSLAISAMIWTVKYFKRIPKWTSMTVYVTLGWLGGFLAIPLYSKIGTQGISLLGIGGLFYTVGGVIFTVESPNPFPGKFGFHEIWHIFVICGAVSHWLLMFFFVLPWQVS